MADLGFSRRSVLASAPAVALAIAVAPSIASEGTAPSEPLQDTRFWHAHAEWKAIRAAWDADTDEDEDAVWARHGERDAAALQAMLLIPVKTAFALMAKYIATGGECVRLPYPAQNSLQMIEWDLGRIAMKELAA